ncbi:Uncharacterised protein [Vibrio cholerae]|uniref:Uncharacterized protein n=1 Tax=Vibrio cholerae TaxID=666 RepID=A0A655ZRB7_VIBCL|nr:Uncharacterised protein [Vibrio cholerae]CSB27886.1 Uncharacterised protein [Vibrio cholerae]CSB81848.1 Uncharacterised protein [Vibrio cholerae]CSC65818.1 Uncharacterised protein [Vibrio cholerae]CSC73630.1 Uncharacterised protein [Vibrio cholerae]
MVISIRSGNFRPLFSMLRHQPFSFVIGGCTGLRIFDWRLSFACSILLIPSIEILTTANQSIYFSNDGFTACRVKMIECLNIHFHR